jgi:hypothetical protein
MSFWPLARRIVEELAAGARLGPLVELGAGDGGLTRRLEELDLHPLLLDRRYPPAPRRRGALAGDVLRLPLADDRVGAIVLGNVLRQLSGSERRLLAGEARRCLRGGGRMVVLEDDPRVRTAAERNYRDCLALLGEADPTRRVATLAPDRARRSLAPVLGPPRSEGEGANEEPVLRPEIPLAWLAARSAGAAWRSRLEDLRRRVEAEGMAYGLYWFQIYARESAG